MLTAFTHKKHPYLRDSVRKEHWLLALQKAVSIHSWNIIAWVVLDNHYHTIVQAPILSAGAIQHWF